MKKLNVKNITKLNCKLAGKYIIDYNGINKCVLYKIIKNTNDIDFKIISTNENMSYKELQKFAKKHNEYTLSKYLCTIIWSLLISQWIILLLKCIPTLDKIRLDGIFYGISLSWLICFVIGVIMEQHNDNILK